MITRYRIYKIELSIWDNMDPYCYILRANQGVRRCYRAYTPLRYARFLNMALALASRYEASVTPSKLHIPESED